MPPKSKPGEGIVIVVDVGPAVRASTETTFYSSAKKCLINILQRKIFAEKGKDMVGIVLFGTDETSNSLATGNQYQHVTVLQQPKLVDWDLIDAAERLPRGNSQGDWLDAIIVAMDLLHDPSGILFSTKKIVLMTDFNCEFSDDQTNTIIDGLRSMEIDLSVIGPSIGEDDDDDDDKGMDSTDAAGGSSSPSKNAQRRPRPTNWNGKPKTPQQLAAECLIQRIVREVDGIICSFEDAINQLIFFEKKSQGSANWNAMMDIGPNFKIPVVGKIKIKRSTPTTWKKAYAQDESAAIIGETSFLKKDSDQTAVSEEDIISGYKYGTTLVPFGEEDSQLKYTCEAQAAVLSVLGFTKASNVPLPLRAGDQVVVITAKDVDEDGAVALSAVIQALKELDMVAITRRVYRKNLNPVLGALFPEITPGHECLVWVGLPFQEDVRHFTFPSLEKAMENGTQEQRDLMDRLITGMDLAGEGEDDDECLDPKVVVNPQLQHYYNCLTHRALNPTEPLPAPEQHIRDLLSPPAEQRHARDSLAAELKRVFPTKKIDDYKKKKVDLFANSSTDTGLEASSSASPNTALTSSDLTSVTVHKISTATPLQDFQAMLRGSQPNYPAICSQLSDVLLQLTESLSGDASSDNAVIAKVTAGIRSFRTEARAIDPTPFNDFMRQLKQVVAGRSLTGIWLVITQESLGLIAKEETLKSGVTEEESAEFLRLEEAAAREAPSPVPDDADYDDMLDDL